MYEIEKGIPGPDAYIRPTVPWGDMEIGDSVFLPKNKPGSAYQRALKWTKENGTGVHAGKKFRARQAEKDGQAGSRVWRVA